ncbi:MAG: MBL fold metallo-hydrolase [Anaerolineae bacterium]|jgi:glyoxylase-like metal-dependent hydrolase (beta-lactamase superfamily II)
MEVVPGLHWVERIWDTKVYVLLEDSRVVVIDAAMPGRAGAVWRHLDTLGHQPEAVDEIWLTHGDIDHMGSVAALKARSGARVVAHRADVDLVAGRAQRELGPSRFTRAYKRVFNWAIYQLFRYKPVAIDQPVTDNDTLGDWQVVHTPGHTPGSVSYYHPGRGIAIVGDAINHKRGRLGAPPPLVTYDLDQAYDSVRRIAALDFEVCCFGHGPPLLEHAQQRVQALADSLPLAGE